MHISFFIFIWVPTYTVYSFICTYIFEFALFSTPKGTPLSSQSVSCWDTKRMRIDTDARSGEILEDPKETNTNYTGMGWNWNRDSPYSLSLSIHSYMYYHDSWVKTEAKTALVLDLFFITSRLSALIYIMHLGLQNMVSRKWKPKASTVLSLIREINSKNIYHFGL